LTSVFAASDPEHYPPIIVSATGMPSCMTRLMYTFSIVTTQSEIAGVYTVTVTVSDGAQQVS